MIKISVVGCTGKLGQTIIQAILMDENLQLVNAITRKGSPACGKDIATFIGSNSTGVIISDSITQAQPCDVFIDCTPAECFEKDNAPQYLLKRTPVVVATTGLSEEGTKQLGNLAIHMPVLQSGNFSIALHDFIETLKIVGKRVSADTDVQIIEYHHNQKKDAPSGTAKMIQDALIQVNERFNIHNLKISSVRGGNIFGEHRVIFANCSDEVVEYRHQVSSRLAFANGAVAIAQWLSKQNQGLYVMDDFIAFRNSLPPS